MGAAFPRAQLRGFYAGDRGVHDLYRGDHGQRPATKLAGAAFGVNYPAASPTAWGLTVSPTGDAGDALNLNVVANGTITTTLNITYRLVNPGTFQTETGPAYADLPGLFLYYSTNGGSTWTRAQNFDSNTESDATANPSNGPSRRRPMD